MENITMTKKQYNLLAQLHSLVESMNQEKQEFKDMINDANIFEEKLDSVGGNIEFNIEIVGLIKRYLAGEYKDLAVIGISNSMSVIIIESESDYVFGCIPFQDDGTEFFLSEVTYKDDEDSDEARPFFTIGLDGLELCLGDAMRIGGR